jgi:hypothetical protein
MRKSLIPFLTLFIALVTKAQTALIKDLDGYCNIRQSSNSQSKIIDTISNDKIVFVFEEQGVGNWLPIDYKKGNETLSGYIHKSRITFLKSLTNFKQVLLNDSILKLKFDSIQLFISKISFKRKDRQIKYDKPQVGQRFIKSIDNKFPWGTDGNIPKKEYKAIQFKIGNSNLNFTTNTFKDLFEPNLNMTMAYQDKTTGKFYIEAFNSDGAGGYVVIWTIKDKQIIDRTTLIPF